MTKIEWTEATWNPIVGCSIVSPGCTNCYAMRMAARIEAMDEASYRKRVDEAVRFIYDHDGEEHLRARMNNERVPSHYLGTTRPSKAGPVWTGKLVRAPDHILTEPLRRKKPTMYFVNSMSDLFHEDVPDEWIDRVFAVMALCPQHTFQVLTKRSARMREYMTRPGWAPKAWHYGERMCTAQWPLPNVWLGVSAERQIEADARIPDLLATPAAVRFVSAEPLLAPIDFTRIASAGTAPFTTSVNSVQGTTTTHVLDSTRTPDGIYEMPIGRRLDWIIVGGESGPGARPMHPDWARSIRDQCTAAGVPFFFKQWGEWVPGRVYSVGSSGGHSIHEDGEEHRGKPSHWWSGDSFDGVISAKVGKGAAGSLLDGREWKEWPTTSKYDPQPTDPHHGGKIPMESA